MATEEKQEEKEVNVEDITQKVKFREVRHLFLGVELIGTPLLILLISFGYLWFVTKAPVFSGVVAIVVTVFFFFKFTIPNRRLKHYQNNLEELMKYVNNMVFYLQSGNNVLNALIESRKTANKNIAADLDITIETLREDAVLDLEHFKKYNFPTLDQFHRNLEIRDDRGGEAKELFDRIQDGMLFELKKRDELDKKRKGFSLNVYTLLLLVVSMMFILRTFVTEQWEIFLSYHYIGFSVLGITVLLVLVNLNYLQKHSLDISVRV